MLYPEGLPVGIVGFMGALVGCFLNSGASSEDVFLGDLAELGSQLMI